MQNLAKQNATFLALVSDAQYTIVMQYSAGVGSILSFLGIVSNIINIRTFISMGLKDGVIVSFLALAVFDLIYLISSFSLGISTAFYIIELKSTIRFQIEPYAISIFFGSVTILINITNVLTTTFIAVARCMCVARPLQFKNTFTRRMAVMFIVAFALFAVAIYTPLLANMGIVKRFNVLTNKSRPSFWMSKNRENVKEIVWLVTEMFLPFATQFILIVCVIIMAHSLVAASKFRNASTLFSKDVSTKVSKTNVTDRLAESNESKNTTDKLTGKDLRVVQQVVLISAVYIVCNTPKILISVVTSINPEFTIGKGYTKLYICVNGLRKHFEIVNSAVNLMIYYKYNRKFRERLIGVGKLKKI